MKQIQYKPLSRARLDAIYIIQDIIPQELTVPLRSLACYATTIHTAF